MPTKRMRFPCFAAEETSPTKILLTNPPTRFPAPRWNSNMLYNHSPIADMSVNAVTKRQYNTLYPPAKNPYSKQNISKQAKVRLKSPLLSPLLIKSKNYTVEPRYKHPLDKHTPCML